ncbi:MAG TPA: Stp1/IreP family PP2C-type Ser/Thr phosphatase, partial [Actinomycetota bacterium]
MTAGAVDRGGPRYAAATDVGLVRSNNEDAFLTAPPLFAVADGMGGHRAGEVASAGAIRTLQKEAGHDTDSLVAAVQSANRVVHAEAAANPDLSGMGTTITAMMTTQDSAQIVHVGDSRAYLLREGRLRRLTQDHTVVERLAREGKIPANEVDRHPQRSVLERALGVNPEVDVDVQLLDVRPGDRLLLCTDGLTSMLDDDEIREILLRESDPETAAQALIDAALAAGGKDNVTAVIVDFPRPDSGAADSSRTADRTAEQPAVVLAGRAPYPSPRLRGQGGWRPAGESAATSARIPPPYRATHRASQGVRHAGPPSPPAGSRPSGDGDPSGAPGRPASRPSRTRLLLGVAIVVPLLALALVGGFAALRSSWYVGEQGGRVAVFRGVPGSFAGIRVSSLDHVTDIATVSLPAIYQQQLRDGISAADRKAADRTAENMRHLQ